jgi:hypothetical protein
MKHPSYSPDLASNDFWLFPKIKCALKGRTLQDTEDIPHPQKSDNGTRSYSTTGIPKMFRRAKCTAAQGEYFEGAPHLSVSCKYTGTAAIKLLLLLLLLLLLCVYTPIIYLYGI